LITGKGEKEGLTGFRVGWVWGVGKGHARTWLRVGYGAAIQPNARDDDHVVDKERARSCARRAYAHFPVQENHRYTRREEHRFGEIMFGAPRRTPPARSP